MDFNALISTLIGGGLALVAFLHISNAVGVNRKANFVFGIFCLIWASFWLDEVIGEQFISSQYGFWFTLKIAQFFVGLVFFTSVRYYTNPDFRFTRKDLLMLIPPFFFTILLLNRYNSSELTYNICYLALFLGHSLAYTVLSYVTVVRHQKTIETFSSNTEAIDLRWIKYITYSFIITLLVIIGYNIFRLRQPLNLYVNFHLLVVVYIVSFYSIRQKEIFPRGLVLETNEPLPSETEDAPAKAKRLIDEPDLDVLKEKLIHTIENDKLYLDSELNLLKLAEKLQLSSHQLSFVLNNGIGENFFNFINSYRVKKAGELLTDPDFDYLTIVAIGFESGFNSKTSFNTTFKKMTSFTPTEFRARARVELSEAKIRSGLQPIQVVR